MNTLKKWADEKYVKTSGGHWMGEYETLAEALASLYEMIVLLREDFPEADIDDISHDPACNPDNTGKLEDVWSIQFSRGPGLSKGFIRIGRRY